TTLPHPPSSPTRRSSDLVFALEATMDELAARLGMDPLEFRLKNDPSEVRREEFSIGAEKIGWKTRDTRRTTRNLAVLRGVGMARSEEHTSELQSRFDLVC